MRLRVLIVGATGCEARHFVVEVKQVDSRTFTRPYVHVARTDTPSGRGSGGQP